MFCLSLMYERKAKHCHPSKNWLSLLTLPQASSCDQNQSYNFQSTDRQRMEKSGFFRQHLITSIRRQRQNFRNAQQNLTADLSPWSQQTLNNFPGLHDCNPTGHVEIWLSWAWLINMQICQCIAWFIRK